MNGTADQQVESDPPEHAPQGVRVLGDDSDLEESLGPPAPRRPFARHHRAARGRDEELLRGIDPLGDLAPAQVRVVGSDFFEKLSNVIELAVVQEKHRGNRGHSQSLVIDTT